MRKGTTRQCKATISSIAFAVPILVAFLNCTESFKRLFRSVEASIPISNPVRITILLDRDDDKNTATEFLQYLEGLKSKHGPVTVIKRPYHFGLRKNVLLGWMPDYAHEYAIFLEDDIEVSPAFLYLSSVYTSILHPFPGHIMSVSLFNERVNQQTGTRIQPAPGERFRLYQQAQSWGAVFSPTHWTEFQNFALVQNDRFDPNITETPMGSNNWDFKLSWKKYMLYYMYYKKKFTVYPSFPENKSITTHHVEPSPHFPERPSEERLNNELRPKLLELSDIEYMVAEIPEVDSMPMYDMRHTRIQ